MKQLLSGILIGAVVGFAATFVAVRQDAIPLKTAWRKVSLDSASVSKRELDDPDCFPSANLVNEEAIQSLRDAYADLAGRLPEDAGAIFRSLLLRDRPIPYEGQRALRSMDNMHALRSAAVCKIGGGDQACVNDRVQKLALDANRAFSDDVAELTYKTGLWERFAVADLKKSAFCIDSAN